MSLDFSQKQLLKIAAGKKRRGSHDKLLNMKRKRNFVDKLQIYAFWTGFMSTIISLCQVIIIALKK